MKEIKSRQNQEIKDVCGLHKSDARYQQNKFLAEGERTVTTLLSGKTTLHQLYVTEEHAHTMLKHVKEDKICMVTLPVMEKISQATTPSGICGVFSIPKKPTVETLSSGLVMVHVSDPGNMGTLVRTSAAMNVSSVVAIEGVDPWSFKVVQASAGYITHVHLFQWSWPTLIKNAHKQNISLSALVVSGGKSPETITKENTLLVVGSEAHGIPSQLISQCDENITVPMPGNIESLNVAVAGSIALYLAFKP